MSYFKSNFTLELITANTTNFIDFDPSAGKIVMKPQTAEDVGNHTVEIVLSWLDKWRFRKELNLTVVLAKEVEVAYEVEVKCPKLLKSVCQIKLVENVEVEQCECEPIVTECPDDEELFCVPVTNTPYEAC